MLVMSLVNFTASLLTWTANGVAICKGVTVGVKRFLVVAFWLGIILIISNEALGMFSYFLVHDQNDYHGVFNQVKI
jgi:hypothetical protein